MPFCVPATTWSRNSAYSLADMVAPASPPQLIIRKSTYSRAIDQSPVTALRSQVDRLEASVLDDCQPLLSHVVITIWHLAKDSPSQCRRLSNLTEKSECLGATGSKGTLSISSAADVAYKNLSISARREDIPTLQSLDSLNWTWTLRRLRPLFPPYRLLWRRNSQECATQQATSESWHSVFVFLGLLT